MTTDNQHEGVLETTTIVQHDYFGFASDERFLFPDGVTYIDFKVMNEGKKAKFQREIQRDLTILRSTGDARMRTDPSAERHALIDASASGWNLVRGPERRPVPFNGQNLRDFLSFADPKVVEDLETAIRKANPWLQGDMSVEDIDREMENLRELREAAEKRESEKAASSSK